MNPKNKRDIIVYRNEYAYCAWPEVKISKNGEWIIAFCEGMRRRRITHRDPTAHNVILRSKNQGRTWELYPQVVPNYDFYGMDDPGLAQLSNGDLLMNAQKFFYVNIDAKERIPNYKHYMSPGLPEASWVWSHGPTYVHRSVDGGHTWIETVQAHDHLSTLREIVELNDGTLLLPCYDETQEPSPAIVLKSKDGGKTWGEPSIIARDEVIGFYEPALLSLPSGKIIAMLRTHEPGGWHLYQCDSHDGGVTWSKPKKTPMWGYPAHLLRLSDARILCVYGYRRPPYGIRACLSHDDGETWDIENEIVIRDDFPNADLGYPTSVQLEDETIFTAYYGQDKDGVTCIWGSYYKL